MENKGHFFWSVLLLICLASCEEQPVSYRPDQYLTPNQQDLFLQAAGHSISQAPESLYTASSSILGFYKKNTRHNGGEAKLELVYTDEHTTYFLISSPSGFRNKRFAAGGKAQLNAKGEIIYFEEVFRTWKMEPDLLQMRSYFLFDKMVTGEPLSPYYTKNSEGVDFIEYPDDRTFYDKKSRSWKLKH